MKNEVCIGVHLHPNSEGFQKKVIILNLAAYCLNAILLMCYVSINHDWKYSAASCCTRVYLGLLSRFRLNIAFVDFVKQLKKHFRF